MRKVSSAACDRAQIATEAPWPMNASASASPSGCSPGDKHDVAHCFSPKPEHLKPVVRLVGRRTSAFGRVVLRVRAMPKVRESA